jgi:acetoin utilization deacetylase AcuC-like enzyme
MLKVSWAPQFVLDLPPGHRFPMEKYRLLPEQLLYEGTITERQMVRPDPIKEEEILRVHDKAYWEKLKNLKLSHSEEKATGFPQCAAMVERECLIMQGTIDMCLHAHKFGAGLNIAGGTHHAFSNRGEGFCLLNDLAISASYILHHRLARKVLIIDLDVHQGNGTAEIFRNHHAVFTFSMHGEKNYPGRKEQSHRDIGLPDGTTDEAYLGILNEEIKKINAAFDPDFVIFQSGVDVLAGDKMGRLSLSTEGCKERDRLVFEYCFRRGIPVVAAMGGGYAPEIKTIIEAHANTFRVATHLFGN